MCFVGVDTGRNSSHGAHYNTMITEQWLKDNAAVVPDDAFMYARHPSYYILNLEGMGWTRYSKEDAIDGCVRSTDIYAKSRLIASKFRPDTVFEHGHELFRLLSDRNLQESFRKDFDGDSIPATVDLIRAVMPEAKQVILKLAGGRSWFIWGFEKGAV